MKHSLYKWLRRVYVAIAVKLFIFAICLTLLRLFFVSVEDYKENFSAWLATEYNIDLSAESISAGVDFDGIVITFSHIKLAESPRIPIAVSSNYLFLHLDFWDSIVGRTLKFNRVSLQGVDLTIKKIQNDNASSPQSLPIIDSLQKIFLHQLDQFSIKNSQIHFTTRLNVDKTIVIEKLRWLNEGDRHQGVGSALLPDKLGDNSLQFVINVSGEQGNKDNPLHGKLYVEADNLNITDYLAGRVGPKTKVLNAVLGVQAWSEFSLTQLQQVQVVLKNSKLSWSNRGVVNDWQLNNGLLQLTQTDKQWLLDSYNLDIKHNNHQLTNLKVSGHGDDYHATLDFTGLYLKDLLPFSLLSNKVLDTHASLLNSLAINGEVKHLVVQQNKQNSLHFAAQLKHVSNHSKGKIPGISDANIELQGDESKGYLNIKLPKQKIYFDQQFSRTMPVQSANLDVHWLMTPAGLKIFSEQSVLKTDDVDSITAFSLLLPNQSSRNRSPFLSLYSYASLNDAAKAQYYYPIKALKLPLFNYLQPTLQKGKVKGAKVLWYGALNGYPYRNHDGIFQAWVPLRDAQYNFYNGWPGLTDLDVNLFFNNDSLSIKAQKASLGGVKLQKLTANIAHLHPTGQLDIDASISADAQKIEDYINLSPLKNTVGQALGVIQVKKNIAGKLQITVPFSRTHQQPKVYGALNLANNDIDVRLTDSLSFPLKNVSGKFNFVNGNITAPQMKAELYGEPLKFVVASIQKKETYQVNVDIDSFWNLQKLSKRVPELASLQLSGDLDWTGNIYFKHYMSGGYESRITLNSVAQGLTSNLPAPFNKNALQSWPTQVQIFADKNSSTFNAYIKDKLDFAGQIDYGKNNKALGIPYFSLKIGPQKLAYINKNKHLINIALDSLNLTDWYQVWQKLQAVAPVKKDTDFPDITADQVIININQAELFAQPLTGLKVNAVNNKRTWKAQVHANEVQGSAEYRAGLPSRWDIAIAKLNIGAMDFSAVTQQKGRLKGQLMAQHDDLQMIYPEIMLNCTDCHYGDLNLSPLKLHAFPDKRHINIDYLNIGVGKEYTNISGVWDQRRTSIIVNSVADKNNDIIQRLGFVSPVVSDHGELNTTVNWLGAPWQYNFESLNGKFSLALTEGAITQVDDKGARLLSLLSLNAIRQAINLKFDNIFDKGFNFDELTMSGSVTDGIIKNDDFYLDGSAGKIVGSGLIDLPHYETNYKFSYSPAITSSLPVLTAFAINPLTGAAVLFLTKILEPVVETIIRVDFTVHGSLTDPIVKLTASKKGKVKLQNSKVLEEMNKLKITE